MSPQFIELSGAYSNEVTLTVVLFMSAELQQFAHHNWMK